MARPRSAALLVVLAFAAVVPAHGFLSILGQLKKSRDGTIEVLSTAAKSLKEAREPDAALAVEKWSDDWLSILGMSRGLTGLVKDFVLGYLGRSSYHDANGWLIGALKDFAKEVPKKGSVTKNSVRAMRDKLLDVCETGMDLFKSGGSLHTMLSELKLILVDSNLPHFYKGLHGNDQIKEVFEYLAGPRPPTDENKKVVETEEL